MSTRLKNTLIGLFVIVAVAITIGLILFLKPTIGDGKKIYKVRFSNISGIGDGTRVTFAGRPVGEVTSIEEVHNARQEPKDELGRVYFYQLTIRVDSSVDIYNTDEVTLQTTGLMGEKSVAIIPMAPPRGKVPKLITNQIIYAESIDPFQHALNEFSNVAKKVEVAVGDFNQWFVENSPELTRVIQSASGSMNELNVALNTFNQEDIIPSTREVLDLLDDNLRLARSAMEEMHENDTVAKFNTLLENLAESSEAFNIDGRKVLCNLNLITQDIADGTGTLGKIVKGDGLYLNVMSILNKVETTMNDINHYGVLFQYDKNWQRIRTRRANILDALSTPREFRTYFATEVDSISTAISRLSILLEKANSEEEKAKIYANASFQKDFIQLLRHAETLTGSLRLYNEQLVETLNTSCQ